MILLFIKTICKANDMEIFVEKSFSVIIKKYNAQARLLYMMNLLYFFNCTTNRNLCSFTIII